MISVHKHLLSKRDALLEDRNNEVCEKLDQNLYFIPVVDW